MKDIFHGKSGFCRLRRQSFPGPGQQVSGERQRGDGSQAEAHHAVGKQGPVAVALDEILHVSRSPQQRQHGSPEGSVPGPEAPALSSILV